MRLRERVRRRRLIYDGSYLKLERLEVELPDGQRTRRDVVRPPDAVAVVPLDGAGNVILVRQYRIALDRIICEIPAGIIDPEERPRATALRECREEIGMRPARLRKLCHYYHAAGFSTGSIHLYLAEGLREAGGSHTDPTEFLEVVRIPFRRALRMVETGQIIDAKSVIGLLWTERLLRARPPRQSNPPQRNRRRR